MLVFPGGIERTEEEYRVSAYLPLVEVTRRRKGYTHVNERDDVDLIRKTRWNDITKNILREINPAYRDFLLAVRRKDNLGLSLPRGSKRP